MKCQILFSGKKNKKNIIYRYQTEFDIPCKLFKLAVHANCLQLDSLHAMSNSVSWERRKNNNKKTNSKCHLLKILPRVLSIKEMFVHR